MFQIIYFLCIVSHFGHGNGEVESVETVRSTNFEDKEARPAVEITKHQYCLGCKHTVDTFAKVTAQKIEEMVRL